MDYSDIFNDNMFFRFNSDFVDVTFEHWVGNQLVSIQKQRGPDMMLRSSFLQACQNVMGREPTKLILKRWEKNLESNRSTRKSIRAKYRIQK